MLAVVLLVAGSVAPVAAQTVTRQDPTGDAPARIDVTAARYSHTDRRVRVVASIPDLGRAGTAALSITRFEIFEAGYVVQIRKRLGHAPRTRLFSYNHFDLEPRACRSVTGTWGDERVTLSVARSCLVGHARHRIFVQFGIQRGDDVDHAPPVTRLRRS